MKICALVISFLVASSSALSVKQPIQNVNTEGRVPAEYLVTVRADTNKNLNLKIEDILKKIEAHSSKLQVHDIHTFGKTTILVIHSEDEREVVELGAIQEIDAVETDIMKKVLDCEEQSVVSNKGLWNLARINQRNPNNNQTYRYQESDGVNTAVYVVDTGVRITHKDFEGRASHGYTVPKVKEVEGDDDLNGHGTHCAGTVAGATFGAAKAAEVVNVKVLNQYGFGLISEAVEGLKWIYNDYMKRSEETGSPYKAVISMSLGWPRSSAMDAAVQELSDAGILLVASAGNSRTFACGQSPSGAPASLGVAASDSTDTLAFFSNYGECADIIAPGTNILSAGIADDADSTALSGTSMATPLVAGVLLRHMSQVGYRTPADLLKWVQETSTKDTINLRGLHDTLNYLLYAPCDLY